MNPIQHIISYYNPITPLINIYQLESLQAFIKHDKEDDFLNYINKWEIDPLQIQLQNMDLIHFCAAKGWCRVIKLLIERGEDINKPCALNYLTESTQKKTINYRLPENNHTCGDTPIHLALIFRQNAMCQLLLESDVNLQVRPYDSLTPLMIALFYKDQSLIEMILAKTETECLHYTDRNGNNALHYAVVNANEHTIRQLLDMKVNLNCVNKLNQTPLCTTSEGLSEPLFMELVNATDEKLLNNINSYGQTILSIATAQKFKSACRLLIKRNADPSLVSEGQITPLMQAISHGLNDLAIDYLDVISIEDINKRDMSSGETALHLAVMKKNMSLCQILLEKGANPNISTKDGLTPLILAIVTKNFSLAKILLEKSNLTHVDKDGWNSSHYALKLLKYVSGRERGKLKALSFDQHQELNQFVTMQRSLTLRFHASFNIELNGKKIRIEDGISSVNFDKIRETLQSYLIENELHENPVFSPLFTKDVIWPQMIASEKLLRQIEKGKITILSTGWRGRIGKAGHAVSVVISGKHLYLCNRGRGKKSGITIYEILNLEPLEPDLKKMLKYDGESKQYLTLGIDSSTHLKKVLHISQKPQRIGNCTWTSPKSAVFALLMALHVKSRAKLNDAIKPSKLIYKNWSMSDRNIILYTYIKKYLTGPYDKLGNKSLDLGVVPIHRALTEVLIGTGKKNRSNWAKLMRRYIEQHGKLENIGISEISWAIIDQDFLKAEKLIEESTFENTIGYSPLHFAALSGNELIVKKLISKGLKSTGKHNDIPTPVHLAIKEGHIQLAQFLIPDIPDLNLSDQNGQTILHLACKINATNIILELLGKSKVDINKRDDDGITPLMIAIIRGFDQLAGLLITHQNISQLNTADNRGQTAFYYAANHKSERICKLLIKKNISLNVPDDEGIPPLFFTLANGQTKLSKSIIEKLKDEDLNQANIDGWTAFHLASTTNQLEICKLLLNRGTSPTQLNNAKKSPLILSIQNGHARLSEWLIGEMKVQDLNQADKDGWTAFHQASMHGQFDICKLLLKNGANPNIDSKGIGTPLTVAISFKRTKLAKWLIGKLKDEDLNYVGRLGMTIFNLALESNQSEICGLLIARGLNPKGNIIAEKNK